MVSVSFSRMRLLLLVVVAITAPLAACVENGKGGRLTVASDPVSPAQWTSVLKKRILFGHQSVGYNLISGVESLARRDGVELKLTESRAAAGGAGIIHFKIGRNEDPDSKLQDFAQALENGLGQGADVALMKLCYIDFNEGTDAQKLAQQYCATLDSLSRKFPKTAFVAVTAPLTTVQTGPKAWLKRLMGRKAGGYAENYRRQEFNAILRKVYEPGRRLFDLAKIEAEGSPGYRYEGRALEVLNSGITSDGGHLNTLGEQMVAARLIKLIAALPDTAP